MRIARSVRLFRSVKQALLWHFVRIGYDEKQGAFACGLR